MNEGNTTLPPFDTRQQVMFNNAPIIEAAQSEKAKADAEVARKVADAAAKAQKAKEKEEEDRLRDSWGTPRKLFDPLHAEFQFSLDVCAEHWNRKLDTYYGPGSPYALDGLAASWAGQMWWCNPPFSQIDKWLAYAWRWFSPEARAAGMMSRGGVMLLPATRTEQAEWQTLVEPYLQHEMWSTIGVMFRARFIAMATTKSKYGRVQFDPPPGLKKSSNTAGSVLLIWRPL